MTMAELKLEGETLARPCDGKTFLGVTYERCNNPATVHRWADQYEQYDFCPTHDFWFDHGHLPGDEIAAKTCRKCNPHFLRNLK